MLHKIGDVAEMLSTSVRTLRYYEEEGLLTPVRTGGGTRLYSMKHVDRLRAILHLLKGGYSIDAVKALAKLRENSLTGDDSQRGVSARMDEILRDIDSRIGELRKLAEEIRAAKQTVSQCAGCSNIPSSQGCPHCPVRDRLHDIELLNLVWDMDE
ncbi:MAG: MerR family transcriptional regulator [Sulfuricella denitrificans]|nr:MerR family transcriptional regulator [Sulfuricella denitrificans]